MTPPTNSPQDHLLVDGHLGDDRLVDLALADELRDEESTHLAGCSSCTDALASLGRAVDGVRDTSGIELVSPPPHVWARIQDELKDAMRDRDNDRRDALRLILSSLQSAEKELQRPLNDQEELQVLQRERKKRVEAEEAFRTAGREEQADAEDFELEVLE